MQQAALTQADEAFGQAVEWLEHFEALDDPRQSGKVMYPLDEMLLLALVGVLRGPRVGSRSRRTAGKSSICCSASRRSSMAHRRMTSSAMCLRHSMRSSFRVVSLPGRDR